MIRGFVSAMCARTLEPLGCTRGEAATVTPSPYSERAEPSWAHHRGQAAGVVALARVEV